MIAAGRFGDAYLFNWGSNVFPGILGRTCDRPCEPACRRVRVEVAQAEKPEPVAICRLKRVGGPASLTVARDLAPIGYHVVVFDQDPKDGGKIRTQIPRFRLPEEVSDEETGYVLGLEVEFRGNTLDERTARAGLC